MTESPVTARLRQSSQRVMPSSETALAVARSVLIVLLVTAVIMIGLPALLAGAAAAP
jgi:hypothetical protein